MQAVLKIILENENFADFYGPQDLANIDNAEATLKIALPKTYKEFLVKFGCGNFGSKEIYGIIKFNDYLGPLPFSTIPEVVWTNLKLQRNFNQPQHIIVISDAGEGSYYALDLSQMNDQGECPVVIWPIGGYEMTPTLEVVAPDFGTWFLEEVKRRIERLKE